MKLWQKIYIVVIVVFFLSFNAGLYALANRFYYTTLDNEKEVAVKNAYFVEESAYNDYLKFYNDYSHRFDSQLYQYKYSMFRGYCNIYRSKDVYLQFGEGDILLYDGLGGGQLKIDWDHLTEYMGVERSTKATLYTIKNEKNIVVRCAMIDPLENNYVIYVHPLTQFYENWNNLLRGFAGIEILVVFFFTIIIYFTIRRTLRPFAQLSQGVNEVASGKYGKPIPVVGKDEVAELTTNFNEMSSKVQESVESLRNLAKAKQNFIDDLGHELRTPLTSISGYSEYLLMAHVDQSERDKALQYILSESKRMQRLSETLLKLAEIREEEIELEWFELLPILERIEQMFEIRMKKKNITFQMDNSVSKVYANPLLIEILLVNIIENAMRAIDDGGNIHLQVKRMNENEVSIEVEDDGIGMEAEALERIREPFFRADKNRSRQSGGVGLGVSLCQRIVEQHEGKLEYESEVGVGTKVTVILRQQLEME